MRWCLAILVLSTACAGCARRELTVTSDPPGALVTINNVEAGRTPFTTGFTWYGTYSVQVRKEGHETFDGARLLLAPWWQWPPFDLAAELMPWHPTDRRSLHFVLKPTDPAKGEPQQLIARGLAKRDELDSKSPPAR
jgi:hypothetical protein